VIVIILYILFSGDHHDRMVVTVYVINQASLFVYDHQKIGNTKLSQSQWPPENRIYKIITITMAPRKEDIQNYHNHDGPQKIEYTKLSQSRWPPENRIYKIITITMAPRK
jgi:hypothetical protein